MGKSWVGVSARPSFDYRTSAAPAMGMTFAHGRKRSPGKASSVPAPRSPGRAHRSQNAGLAFWSLWESAPLVGGLEAGEGLAGEGLAGEPTSEPYAKTGVPHPQGGL